MAYKVHSKVSYRTVRSMHRTVRELSLNYIRKRTLVTFECFNTMDWRLPMYLEACGRRKEWALVYTGKGNVGKTEMKVMLVDQLQFRNEVVFKQKWGGIKHEDAVGVTKDERGLLCQKGEKQIYVMAKGKVKSIDIIARLFIKLCILVLYDTRKNCYININSP